MVCIGRGQRVRVGGSKDQTGLLWDGMKMRGIVTSRRDWLREYGLVVEERRRGRAEEKGEGKALLIVTDLRCGPESAKNDRLHEKVGGRITLPALGELLDHLIVIHPRPPSSQRKLLSA